MPRFPRPHRLYRVTLFVAALLIAAAFGAYATMSASEAARLQSAARIVSDVRGSIPPDYWKRARCVIIVPELKKAAFILGGEYGRGMAACRAGDKWSAPLFMQLAKGSWGFQAGAEQIDLILLVMNESGVQKLFDNKVTLGVDASGAAGPVGVHGAVGTDAALTAEILSYCLLSPVFYSRRTSSARLSSRIATKAACRRLPSRVHSTNEISATSSGRTHVIVPISSAVMPWPQ